MELSTKHTLRFNKDGKFRILMTSDLQETVNYDERALKGLYAMIEAEKPDLVIFGGDNCDGRYLKTREELEAYLKVFTAPMEEKKIPWMHVFGNHDYDVDVPAAEQNEMYRSYEYCVSGVSPEGVPGVTNYALPVLASTSDHVAYCIYAFDTMHKDATFRNGTVTVDDLMIGGKKEANRKWDFVRFEQLLWYWNTSKELETKEGKPVRAMAVMHVPPHEMDLCIKYRENVEFKGEFDEKLQCGIANSGLYATMLQRGDVDIISAGHLHKDTVDTVYGGIRLCLDGCAGFSPKSDDSRRGGRVFEINEDGSHSTYWIAVRDLIDITK